MNGEKGEREIQYKFRDDPCELIDTVHNVILCLCNDQGTWDQGWEIEIEHNYPHIAMKYGEWHDGQENTPPEFQLGEVKFVEHDKANPTWFALLISQKGESSPGRVDFKAIENGFRCIADFCKDKRSRIIVPRNGFSICAFVWEKVEQLIKKELDNDKVQIIVVDRPFYFSQKEHLVEFFKEHGRRIWVSNSSKQPQIKFTPNETQFGGHWIQVPFATRDTEEEQHSQEAENGLAKVLGKIKIISGSGLGEEIQRDVIEDEESDCRCISTLPIKRCFVYIDISEFTQFPAGQQASVISILSSLLSKSYWNIHICPEAHAALEDVMENQILCIGDGYIFILKEPTNAAVFAVYLARLIEYLITEDHIEVEFHFRIGAHLGEVYRFWDPGREKWNYVGDGINGGSRVLAAIQKDLDDVVYFSSDLRRAFLKDRSSWKLHRAIGENMSNKGTYIDKHQKRWRVYQVDFTSSVPNDQLPRLVWEKLSGK